MLCMSYSHRDHVRMRNCHVYTLTKRPALLHSTANAWQRADCPVIPLASFHNSHNYLMASPSFMIVYLSAFPFYYKPIRMLSLHYHCFSFFLSLDRVLHRLSLNSLWSMEFRMVLTPDSPAPPPSSEVTGMHQHLTLPVISVTQTTDRQSS